MNITENLSLQKQNRITADTYNLLRNKKVAFSHIDENMVSKLISSLISPKLEFAATVMVTKYRKSPTYEHSSCEHSVHTNKILKYLKSKKLFERC